jgi:hypothetical protein
MFYRWKRKELQLWWQLVSSRGGIIRKPHKRKEEDARDVARLGCIGNNSLEAPNLASSGIGSVPTAMGDDTVNAPTTMGNTSSSQVLYPGTWMQAPQLPKGPMATKVAANSTRRASRRWKRKLYDHEMRECSALKKKPHQLKVKNKVESDAGCNGKNTWNAALRLHVPQVLDISIINWDAQKPKS